MTQALLRRISWDAPTTRKLPGLLLDAVEVRDATHYLQTIGMYETFNFSVGYRDPGLPCPVTYIDTPVLDDPVGASAGGSLAASSVYLYKVTAVNSRGETVGSNEATGTTTGTNKTLTPSWTPIAGAEFYRVYRTAAGGGTGTEVFLGTTPFGNNFFTDNGTATPGTSTVPTTNTAVAFTAKQFFPSQWVNGTAFGLMMGIGCKSVGFDVANAQSEFDRLWSDTESIGVEGVLMFDALSNGATDLTPAGGAVAPEVGIAILEGYFSNQYYAGVPTLHTPRTIASLLLQRGIGFVQDGDRYFTPLGSKLIAGGGYETNYSPTGTQPPAGELWLYASGEVTVGRGELIQRQELDRSTNDWELLLERPYVVTFDSTARAAVRVEIA